MKLLEVLSLLTPKDHKKFHKFLRSPFFNDGYNATSILKLYEYQRKHKFEVDNPALTKAAMFKYIYVNKDEQQFKLDLERLLSELMELFELYITYEQNTSADMRWLRELAMAKFYRQHGLVKKFDAAIESAQKVVDKQPYRDSHFFYQKFMLAQEEFEFQSSFNIRRNDANLLETHRYLDTFYSLLKMNYASILLMQGTMTEIEAKETLKFVETIKALLNDSTYLMTPVMDIYYRIYQLFHDVSDEKSILEVERLIESNKALIPPDKMIDIQTFYRIFWVKRYVSHNTPDALMNLFEVYDKHLAQGYLYRDGKIHTTTLQSLTNTGLKLKKFDWVKTLLETHTPERIIGKDDAVEIHNFLWANYYFSTLDYEQAEDILISLKFKDIFYDIQVYFLIIKIYYEQKSPLLDDKINALKVKVSRSNMPEAKKAFFYNSLNKLAILQRLGFIPNKSEKVKLLEELNSSKIFAEREWLIEKVEAL
jgi:hypothetical protein